MPRSQAPLYFTIAILALLTVGGFVLAFVELSDLRTAVSDLQFAAARPTPEAPAVSPTSTAGSAAPTGTPAAPPPAAETVVIPTAVIFETRSSPALQPQVALTVAVEQVTRAPDGTATVHFRVYTDRATSYSAFDAAGAFQLIDLEGGSQPPAQTTGTLGSIPARSAAAGTAVFRTDPSRDTIILQVGSGNDIRFYEFNFRKKTYQETAVG